MIGNRMNQLSSLKAVLAAGYRSVGMARRVVVAAALGLSLAAAAGSAIAQNNAARPATAQSSAMPAASPATTQTTPARRALVVAQAAAPATTATPPTPPAAGAAPTPPAGAAAPAGDAAAPAAPAGAAPAGDASATPPAGSDAADAGAPDTRGLDQEVQGLKKDVVDLNRDLFVLEEELLFPANTQVAVFVSMDVGDFFALDSVQLKIDQKEVINYLYTPREVEALLRGGVHRLYLGNLKVGKHELVAFFSGKGPNDRDYKRGASLSFEKGIGAKYLELKINDRQRKQQPEFEIKDWE
jgi:hypothetical protein